MDWHKLLKNPLFAVFFAIFTAIAWPIVSVIECWENDIRKQPGIVNKAFVCLLSLYSLVVSLVGLLVVGIYAVHGLYRLSVYLSP